MHTITHPATMQSGLMLTWL